MPDFVDCVNFAASKLGLAEDGFYAEQVSCIKAAYEGRDCIIVLRTGFGKSAIFQSLPYALGLRDGREDYKVIVITPLNSIMMDQVRQMSDIGLKAAFLDWTATEAAGYEETESLDMQG